jgi:hypothetical protein
MNKYTVCIDYTATVLSEIEAEDADQAKAEALRRAKEAVPYDGLCITVGYVDKVEEGDSNE